MAKVIYGKGIARLRKEMESIKNARLEVGFMGDTYSNGGPPVAYIATIHEFGYPAGGIPARPFMRPAIADNSETWKRRLAGGFKKVVNGEMSTRVMLDAIGELVTANIREAIADVTSPPLQQGTIDARLRGYASKSYAAKANPETISKPLVATGYMRDSVKHKVTT